MPPPQAKLLPLGPPQVVKDATLSEDGQHRYWLLRQWDLQLPGVGVIMLNPSTADHLKDDATITALTTMARNWGYGRLEVANLFGYRSPTPDDLKAARDPIGPLNGWYLHSLLSTTVDSPGGAGTPLDRVVAAWGNSLARWLPFQEAEVAVQSLARLTGRQLWCIDVTKDGRPVHPLYQKRTCMLRPWPPT